MSDSVDRVFVHALATVRRLPRTGSSRPPPAARLRLYGLYKQSMEGDVSSILPRPSLPPLSPKPNDPTTSQNSVHRYASRDLRARETQAEIEKWDAWHSCAGLSRTEAKRRYITTLIETMKEYASGTSESRELVSELEFVWNQIKSQSGSEESESGESPTRKMERAGLKTSDSVEASIFGAQPKDKQRDGNGSGDEPKGKTISGSNNIGGKGNLFSRLYSTVSQSRPQPQSRTQSGLKVLSPMSQRSADDIVENEEVLNKDDDEAEDDEDDNNDGKNSPYRTTPSSPSLPPTRPHNRTTNTNNTTHASTPWQTSIEQQLKQLTLEITALREQLSSHHLLSRSSFSAPQYPFTAAATNSIYYTGLPIYRKLLFRINLWIRWILWTATRQVVIQLGLLMVVLVYGRIRRDRRVEGWVREKVRKLVGWVVDGGGNGGRWVGLVRML